jgi:hypothetical protein
MGVGTDPTYAGQSKVYIKQQPAGTLLNSNVVTTEEVTDAGGLQTQLGLISFNNQVLPGKILFTIAPGAATICNVTIQVQDNGGQAIARTDGLTTTAPTVWDLDVILALSTGVLTTIVPSTGMAVLQGVLLNTYAPTFARAMYIQTTATGLVQVSITDTARSGFFVMVQAGGQPIPALSRQLVTGDYG